MRSRVRQSGLTALFGRAVVVVELVCALLCSKALAADVPTLQQAAPPGIYVNAASLERTLRHSRQVGSGGANVSQRGTSVRGMTHLVLMSGERLQEADDPRPLHSKP